MLKNFHESFIQDPVRPPSERATGLVFAVVALFVAVLWRNEPPVPFWALVVAVVLATVSYLAPRLLKPLNILWFKVGLLLHRILNPVVLLTLFASVFVPVGAVMRLWHDPLLLRRNPKTSTYWMNRKTGGYADESMRNQF